MLVINQGSITVSVYANSVTEQSKGINKVKPIPGQNPITIPMGREGPTFKVEGRCNATQRGYIAALVKGGNVLMASSTSYPEFTSYIGTYFFLDEVKITRKAGQGEEWDYMLQFTRNYSV